MNERCLLQQFIAVATNHKKTGSVQLVGGVICRQSLEVRGRSWLITTTATTNTTTTTTTTTTTASAASTNTTTATTTTTTTFCGESFSLNIIAAS